MPTELFTPQTSSKKEGTYFSIIRHAQPQIYGENHSPLVIDARQQIWSMFTAELISQITAHDVPTAVRIFTSDRKRAQQTAEIIYEQLTEQLSSRPDVQITSPRSTFKLLNTAKILQQLQEKLGIPGNQAFEKWKNMSVSELQLLGIESPEILGQKWEKFINRLTEKVSFLREKTPYPVRIHYVWVTHEVTHYGLVSFITPEELSSIGAVKFTEPIVFWESINKQLQMSFRGTTSPLTISRKNA